MDRRPITAAITNEIDRLLAAGIGHTAIATQLGVTDYVVQVIAGDKDRPPRRRTKRRVHNRQPGVDAITIRMIQRMLDVGILNSGEIAREAGVSRGVVEGLATGKREPVSTERPIVFKDLGERALRTPIRCSGCHATITVVPCRACRARRESERDLQMSG